MAKWKYIINVSQYIDEDTSTENIVKASKGIVAELLTLPDTLPGLNDNIDVFSEIADGGAGVDDLLSHFNYELNWLYNWADDNKIWMGI